MTKTTYILDTRTAIPHFPGIGRYVANLARELPALLREDEQLVLLGDGAVGERGKGGKGEREIERLAIDASPFSLAQQWKIPHLLREYRKSAIRAQRAPAHSALLYHSPYYLMPYLPGVPTLLTFYDIIPIAYPEYVAPRARLFFRIATRLACRAASQIVAISQAARADLIHHFAISPAKVTTTPLAPDPRFQPQSHSEIDRVRQKYNLPNTFILYFGINKPHKNLVLLIEGFGKMTRGQGDKVNNAPSFTLSPCPLVIAGAWDDRYPAAKQRAANLGDGVRFLGRIDEADVPALYSAATIFVFPSRYEGFGLPVLEAMACGTPVACSNSSSLPEVAGDAALLFDPQNVDEIATTIERLLSDAALRDDLRQRGLAQASRFTWQRTAQTTLEAYRSVLKNA